MGLRARPIQQPRIRVYGMFGSFKVGAGDSDDGHIRVCYFSTVASGQHTTAAGDSLGLLRELKPMRERVRVSDLRDLSSLLQRELDDRRVAGELVPYLRGENSPVGFFPGILVALVPRGFLMSEPDANYPPPSDAPENDSEIETRYGLFWSAHRFKIDNAAVSLGRLEIDPEHTDLVVLDGQHRANAFRYATGTFEAAQAENSIYHAFYDGVQRPADFAAELPVTVVWFEAQGQIDPKLISRKLFVDVNTNAKEVSESRRVLLNDQDRFSALVGSLYRALALRAFDADRLSLLHMGFDCEERERHSLTLTVPAQVRYAMSYVGFAAIDRFDRIDVVIRGDWVKNNVTYARATRLSPSIDEGDFRQSEVGDREAFSRIAQALDGEFTPKLLEILEGFPLTRSHVGASVSVAAWVQTQNTMVKETWDKVFRGGEGLYAGFVRAPDEGAARNYRAAINEISAEFVRARAVSLSGCDGDVVRRAYDTFGSTAGLTGLWMAAHSFCRIHPDGWAGYRQFIEMLDLIAPQSWAMLLVVYKIGVVKELMPRLWPDLRCIFLRAIQGAAPIYEFFSTDVLESHNPDARYLKTQLNRQVDAFLANLSPGAEDQVHPGPDKVATWTAEARRSLKHALSLSTLKPIHDDIVLDAYCVDYVNTRLTAANVPPADYETESLDEADLGSAGG